MIIYKITNLKNGKIYVGQTIQSLEKRFGQHCYPAKKSFQSMISNAIKKHGKLNFSVKVIDTAKTLDELNKKEESWINHYDSTNRLLGYNIKFGGDNRLCSDETRKKLSLINSKKRGTKMPDNVRESIAKANLGRKLSEDSKKKISEGVKKSLTPEMRKIMSEKAKNRIWSEDTIKRRSETIKKIKNAPENKAKVSAQFKGNKFNLGRKLSEEQKLKIAESLRKRLSDPEEKKKRSEQVKEIWAKRKASAK